MTEVGKVNLTPIIDNETWSPHTRKLKAIVEELTRLAREADTSADAPIETGDYVIAQIETLRDAVQDLLGDELILMMQNIRRPGLSYIDTLEGSKR